MERVTTFKSSKLKKSSKMKLDTIIQIIYTKYTFHVIYSINTLIT